MTCSWSQGGAFIMFTGGNMVDDKGQLDYQILTVVTLVIQS